MREIRRVRAEEWAALRDLRLRALAEAPYAFATTLAQARSRTDDEWRTFARNGAGDARWATYVATQDGRLVGMATGHFPDERHRALDDPGVPSLIQMWVEPSVRRGRVGTELVGAVIAWAVSGGCATLRLTVNSTDRGAIAFYRSLGFHETGRREAMSEGREALEMERRCRT